MIVKDTFSDSEEMSKDSDGDSDMEGGDSVIVKTEEDDDCKDTVEEDVKAMLEFSGISLPEGTTNKNTTKTKAKKELSGSNAKSSVSSF